MKDQRKTEIKVGAMVILSLVIFLWILGWAKNFSLRDTDRSILVRFTNVAGLEIGDYVTVNGVRKGIVEDYNIDGNGVLVSLSLDREVVLKKDAVFAVTMLDLMGGKKIDINPGTGEAELEYDRVQSGTFYADLPAVMSMLGAVQDDLFTTIKEVNITLTSLNKYLTDEKLGEEIRSTMANLKEVSDKLVAMIEENRKGLKDITDNTVVLTRDSKELITENKEEIQSSIKTLSSILSETDSLTRRLNRLTEETLNKENNLGKLLYDEELMSDLRSTLGQAKELIRILTEQLQNDGINVDANVDLF